MKFSSSILQTKLFIVVVYFLKKFNEKYYKSILPIIRGALEIIRSKKQIFLKKLKNKM